METENPVILFDGVCNLCNGAVDFLIKRDKKKQFRFVALQSEWGEELITKFEISPETDSVILIFENKIFLESDAAIEIARLLPTSWSWFSAFKIIPLKFRNGIYKWIVKNRYRWFGKRKTCRVIESA